MAKVPTDLFIQRVFKEWWKEASQHGTNVPTDPSRYSYHRPSSLPFCPVREGYKRLIDGVPTERFNSFTENFYVDIGSKVHELLQRFLGRARYEFDLNTHVEVLGHWKCPRCKKVRRFCTYKECKCGGKPDYHEIEINYRKTHGHMDKVIRIGKWLIIADYKTSSSRAIFTHRKTGEYFPYLANKCQLTRYIGLFERSFKDLFEPGGKFEGCTVVGGLLIYVSRESSQIVEFVWLPASEDDKKAWFKKAKLDDRLFTTMLQAVDQRSLDLMEELIDEKPCTSLKHYEQTMRNKYSECPLKDICFQRKKLVKKMQQAIERPESLREQLIEYDGD